MKLVLKMLLIIILIMVTVSLYCSRSQEIDFSLMLPQEFRNCGQIIDVNSYKYVELKSWLHANKKGWVTSPASHGSENQFTSINIKIIVNEKMIVVNYKSDNGNWKQVAKSKALNILSSKCT